MLDRESQCLDVQEIWLSELTIDVDAKGVCGELGVKPGAQSPEGMSTVGFDVELFGELAVDGLDNLAHGVVKLRECWWELLLITSGQGEQANAVVLLQVGSFGGA